MRRGLWFAAGAGVGIYAMVRGRRAAEALTADGWHDRWQALGVGARHFRDEVATGKAEAEAVLRQRFAQKGLDTPSLVPREGYSTRGELAAGEGFSTGEELTNGAGNEPHDHPHELEEGPQ